MTSKKNSALETEVKECLTNDPDYLRRAVQVALQETLDAQMSEFLGAGRYERNGARRGYRSGSYSRGLMTRVGKLELRVPQDRAGEFSTELFERYQRSEKALLAVLVESYVQGVSTRKVKELTEELCGHAVSASSVSRVVCQLDKQLALFANRPLTTPFPYLILDARYERVREQGAVTKRAVQVAIGIDWDGHRHILAVEMANRESVSSWSSFVQRLKERGLHGVQLVVTDAHEGLQQAISRLLPEALWQRCYVHFLRNALDHLPRKQTDDTLTELRWLYDRRDLEEARRDLATWLQRWAPRHPKLCDWVEANIDSTLTFYQLPHSHHKHLKSTNMIERLNQQIKARTQVARIFPSDASCLRLILALAVEQHEEWLEGHRYLNMAPLAEMRPRPAAYLPEIEPSTRSPAHMGAGRSGAISAAPTS